MEDLLRFLNTYEVWIYGLFGLVWVIYLRKLIVAWGEWRGAVFGMERESAQRRFNTSVTMLVLLGLVMVSEFVMVSFVAPVFPKTQVLPTPTLAILVTPTAVLAGVAQTPTAAIGAAPTAETAVREGCTAGQIEWVDPKPNQELQGTVNLIGTVNLPNLGFYKYEFSTPGTDNWTPIAADTKVKVNELLGVWNTSIVTPGEYLLRLVVTDGQNQTLPVCVVPVKIIAP